MSLAATCIRGILTEMMRLLLGINFTVSPLERECEMIEMVGASTARQLV